MTENITEENLKDRVELIQSVDMDKALENAAEIKINILTSCKDRDKSNYEQFYETVLHSRQDIIDILDKKKKNRSEDEERMYKEFKKNTLRSYKMVCDLLVPDENSGENKPTKIQKIVDKISLVLDYLRYIGADELEKEFNKRGISLVAQKLEDKSEVWVNDLVKQNIKNIFTAGKKVREEVKDGITTITDNIYTLNIPQDLVYEKDSNPTGLKKSDWNKLVDIKTKMMMAKVDEQKDKAEDQANLLAAEKQFEQARAKLMQTKLITMEASIDHD